MNSTIVLIDDDSLTNYINRRILNRFLPGVDILDFTEGRAALDTLKAMSLREGEDILLFLDINMPVMSGWDVLEHLKQELPDLPIKVVMLTSSIDRSDRERAAGYEKVFSFISKPVDSLKLTRLLRELSGEIAASA
jgi:CheY-like chemotaxis protein